MRKQNILKLKNALGIRISNFNRIIEIIDANIIYEIYSCVGMPKHSIYNTKSKVSLSSNTSSNTQYTLYSPKPITPKPKKSKLSSENMIPSEINSTQKDKLYIPEPLINHFIEKHGSNKKQIMVSCYDIIKTHIESLLIKLVNIDEEHLDMVNMLVDEISANLNLSENEYLDFITTYIKSIAAEIKPMIKDSELLEYIKQ